MLKKKLRLQKERRKRKDVLDYENRILSFCPSEGCITLSIQRCERALHVRRHVQDYGSVTDKIKIKTVGLFLENTSNGARKLVFTCKEYIKLKYRMVGTSDTGAR